MGKKAKVLLLEEVPQKKKISLWTQSQYWDSSSSEDERADSSSGDNRWQDLTQKFHLPGCLIKEKKGIPERKPQ